MTKDEERMVKTYQEALRYLMTKSGIRHLVVPAEEVSVRSFTLARRVNVDGSIEVLLMEGEVQ